MAETEDRTEAPTARRLEQAREDGQIAVSREAASFIALLAGTLATFILLPILLPSFLHSLRGAMLAAGDGAVSEPVLLLNTRSLFTAGLKIALPVTGIIMACGVAGGILQSGFLIHPASLLPKFDRVSPLAGAKRLLGGGTLADTLKSVAKFVLFGAIAWRTSRDILPTIPRMVGLNTSNVLPTVGSIAFHCVLAFVFAQLAIAAADVFWTRYQHNSKLRMSRQDIKDEHRNSEGDPHVKGRLRALRAKMARGRMMRAVEDATVVITNPTHYAVALVYEKGSGGAPRIVAKGMDDVAARIREIAQDHRVPIISNPPLARALFPLPLDSEIPLEHFRVVAGIIAYVWKLKRPAYSQNPVS